MATVLSDTGETTVAATDGLWLTAEDAERATGWTLKPEGMCQRRSLRAVARCATGASMWRHSGDCSGGRWCSDAAGETWVLGAGADQRNAALAGLMAPDFTLPDHRWHAAHALGAAGEEGVPLVPGPPGEAVALTCPCGSNCSTA